MDKGNMGDELPRLEQAAKGILLRRGPVNVYARSGEEVSSLPANQLVVPMGGDASAPGGFAMRLLSELGDDAKSLEAAIDAGGPIVPGKPQLLHPGFGEDNHFVLATAAVDGQHTLEGARVAARAVAELAARHRHRWVVLPLIGGGGGGLDSSEVAAQMFKGLLEADTQGQTVDVTLSTVRTRAYEALLAQASSRPQRVYNDLARGDDLLDVESEAHAIAAAVLLSEVSPPLVVGVFGGWGGGKSFVMHLMKLRMEQIRAMPVGPRPWPENNEPRSFPWVGHIYTVEFDAWTFAKNNLWASLVQQIFVQLNDQLAVEKLLSSKNISDEFAARLIGPLSRMDKDARQAFLEAELSDEDQQKLETLELSPKVLWERIENQTAEQRAKLETKLERLAEEREAAAMARAKLEAEAARRVEAAAFVALAKDYASAAFPDIAQRLSELASKADHEDVAAHPVTTLRDVASVFRRDWPTYGVAVGLLFLIMLALGELPALDKLLEPVHAYLKGLGSLVLATIAPLVAAWRRAGSWLSEHWAELRARAVSTRDSRAADVESVYAKLLHDKTGRAAADATEVNRASAEIAKLEVEIDVLRRRTGLARYRSVIELVEDRLGAGDYEGRLGLIHDVQRDLQQLTDSFMIHEGDAHAKDKKVFFPRGPARVVLFIDDLDRCPPKRVVEVFEAIQLLVKTELFVVVLAMDERYVTRALEKEYAGILSHDISPTGLDYIEKIVQIPYRVRKMSPDATSNYLGQQMQVRVEAQAQSPAEGRGPSPTADDTGGEPGEAGPGGARAASPKAPQIALLPTRVLMFEAYQHELLTRCCSCLELSPRSSKRLVNVYKLLKIIWFEGRPHAAPDRATEEVVIALVCLSASYPSGARRLLRVVDRLLGDEGVTFARVFEELSAKAAPSLRRKHDWDSLCDAARKLLPADFELTRLPVITLDLVVSFSLIGDFDDV